MKLGRYIFGIIVLTLFTLFSLANDEIVRINFPDLLVINIGRSVYLPVYLLISLAIFFGVIIGVFIEYLRNIKLRKEINEKNKRLFKIEDELKKSKEKYLTDEEKILNLLD